ncbi:uncharacterized protein A4U43_C08F7040 [Asparagus officinalis]|nr:uncharacterized protein A4U43_C08F7040 [Asparagus officinalis]
MMLRSLFRPLRSTELRRRPPMEPRPEASLFRPLRSTELRRRPPMEPRPEAPLLRRLLHRHHPSQLLGKEKFGNAYRQWQKDAPNFNIDGHYPVKELWDRAKSCRSKILAHKGKSVIVVAHNATNQALVETTLGLGMDYFRVMLQSNCGVSVLDFTRKPRDDSPHVCINRLNQPGPKELPMQCFIKRNKKNSTFYLYLTLNQNLISWAISSQYTTAAHLSLSQKHQVVGGADASPASKSAHNLRLVISRLVMHTNSTFSNLEDQEECFADYNALQPKNPPKEKNHLNLLSVVLRNKAPRWHEHLQCWCLNFHGRVTVASVKNF